MRSRLTDEHPDDGAISATVETNYLMISRKVARLGTDRRVTVCKLIATSDAV